MINIAMAVILLAGFSTAVNAGTSLDSLTSVAAANDLKAVIPSVPEATLLQARAAQSAMVTKENIPGHYVAKLAIEGPYLAVEMIVNKDLTIKVREGNMDQVSPWFSGKWEFSGGNFSYTCNAPGFENNKTVIDMTGVSRAALKSREGAQVMATIAGQKLPFRIWETDKPFFPESPKSMKAAAGLQGSYAGKTRQGRDCGVRFGSGPVQISWMDSSGKYQSCGFFPKSSEQSSNALELSGGSEFSICKAKLTLNESGLPVSARLGISSMVWLGYDETCLNMVRE